jgi:hypothetical protein
MEIMFGTNLVSIAILLKHAYGFNELYTVIVLFLERSDSRANNTGIKY